MIRGARQGSADSQNNLGNVLFHGIPPFRKVRVGLVARRRPHANSEPPPAQNVAEALKWFQLSAEQVRFARH